MAREDRSRRTEEALARVDDGTLDEKISQMASMPMGECVMIVEGVHPMIRWPRVNQPCRENAAMHLVSRLFTDAVFNQDVRAISTIINRIDGGLPKDVDLEDYQTQFGDCINELLGYDESERMKVSPDDTVMMALCKSLYDIASEDIYWDYDKNRRAKPSDTKKQQRDNALRMILERAGGRKTLVAPVVEKEAVELSDWVLASLPEGTASNG